MRWRITLLSACAAPPPPLLLSPQAALTPRDSAALAYDTGRRDATILHRPRTTAAATALALPLGLVATRATGEFWAAPITASGVTLGGAMWAHREMKRPTPTAPDSMRTRYALDDVFLWARYQQGFQEAIEQQRLAEFQRSAKAAGFVALVTGLTYFAFRPRD